MKTREMLAEQYLEWIIDALSRQTSDEAQVSNDSGANSFQASQHSQGMIDGKIGASEATNNPAGTDINTVVSPTVGKGSAEAINAVINRVLNSINSLADSFEGAPISIESKKYILTQMKARASKLPKLARLSSHHVETVNHIRDNGATAVISTINQIETQFQAMYGSLWY